MSVEKNTIRLTTPATDVRPNPDTIIKPHDLRAWVDDLPYANPLGTAQAVLSSLKQLNRHPKKIPQRTKLMRIYLEPFNRIMERARKLSCTIQPDRSPNKNNGEILALAGALCTEMSYGFKHIVNNEAQPNNKSTPEETASHIQLAMHCLSLGLMFEMSSYRKESRSVWREIFQLLNRAQQLGIANLTIEETTPKVEHEVSVLNSFKCILLTSMLDSSRLCPEDTWASYDYLQWHATTARLIPVKQVSDHRGNYLMPRDGMIKPILFDPKKPPTDPLKYMVCETRKLNLQINNHLKALSMDESAFIQGADKPGIEKKKQLLKQMLHIWHTNPKRRHKRKDKFDRLSCAFGVSAVYHFLKIGTMRNMSSTAGNKQNNISQNYLINLQEEPNLSDGLHIYEFRQEDTSANGIGIMSSEPKLSNLNIGQLIVVESKINETPGPLQVGIVRRIVNRDHTIKEVGVQHLPGRPLPATTMPEILGHKHNDLQPCLLLELGEGHPKVIITPNLVYKPSRHYILDVTGGDTKRTIAGKLLESTSSFDCFEYNTLQHS
ncbi:MAG: hypothetical protein GY814_10215 [Gammaproteobacteria bacterium]|nr:hypothetical protein [Gammaproteobacteria bacterium]